MGRAIRCLTASSPEFSHQTRLVEWYRAGVDVARELPKLSTYLGHVEVGLTYWYIEGIPEVLTLATERLVKPHRPGGER